MKFETLTIHERGTKVPKQDTAFTITSYRNGQTSGNPISFDSSGKSWKFKRDVTIELRPTPLSDWSTHAYRTGLIALGSGEAYDNIDFSEVQSITSVTITNELTTPIEIQVKRGSVIWSRIRLKPGGSRMLKSTELDYLDILSIRYSLYENVGTTPLHNIVQTTTYSAHTFVNGSVKIEIDQDEALSTVGSVLVGGAIIGSVAIGMNVIRDQLAQFDSMFDTIGKRIGVAGAELLTAYALAWGGALSAEFYTLDDLRSFDVHSRMLKRLLSSPLVRAVMVGTISLNALGGDAGVAAAGGLAAFLATEIFKVMSVYHFIAYCNDSTEYEDPKHYTVENTNAPDLEWEFDVGAALSYDVSTTPTMLTIVDDTISSNSTAKFKRDARLRLLPNATRARTNSQDAEVTVSPEGGIQYTGSDTVAAWNSMWYQIGIDPAGGTYQTNPHLGLRGFYLKNNLNMTIGVGIDDGAFTDFASEGPGDWRLLEPGDSMIMPYDVLKQLTDAEPFRVIVLLWDLGTSPLQRTAFVSTSDKTLLSLLNGHVEVELDMVSKFEKSQNLISILGAVASSQVSKAASNAMSILLSSMGFQNALLSALGTSFYSVVSAYGTAWGIATALGFVSGAELMDMEHHKEILAALMKDDRTLLATAGLFGSTLLDGVSSALVNVGASSIVIKMVLAILAVRSYWVSWD
jgi:hypothetical protein